MSEQAVIRWAGRLCAASVFACSYISAWRHEWGDMASSLIISLIWLGVEIRDLRK